MVKLVGRVNDVIQKKDKEGKEKKYLIVYVRGSGQFLIGVNGSMEDVKKVLDKKVEVEADIPSRKSIYCFAKSVRVINE